MISLMFLTALIQAGSDPVQLNITPVDALEAGSPQAVLLGVARDRHLKPIAQAVLSQWQAGGVAPSCASGGSIDVDGLKSVDVIQLRPVVLNEQGAVLDGQVVVRNTVDWCGAPRKFNILVEFQNGTSRAANMVVGDTMAEPLLQMDILRTALPLVGAAMSATPASCSDRFPLSGARLTDTAVLSKSDEGLPPRSWTERWTWSSCGQPIAFDIVMTTREGGGTTFDISPSAL